MCVPADVMSEMCIVCIWCVCMRRCILYTCTIYTCFLFVHISGECSGAMMWWGHPTVGAVGVAMLAVGSMNIWRNRSTWATDPATVRNGVEAVQADSWDTLLDRHWKVAFRFHRGRERLWRYRKRMKMKIQEHCFPWLRSFRRMQESARVESAMAMAFFSHIL